jgi:hypothetical protein
LWGDDWVAPLAQVLGVNRRTVERWRNGDLQIPAHIVAELVRLPRLGSATRHYGELLLRLAAGDRLDELQRCNRDQMRALRRLEADLGRYAAIPVLASGPER